MTLDVECHRCGYAWNYTGSSDYYASCPQCKTSVPIEGGAPSSDSEGSSGDPPAAEAVDTSSDDDLERLSARVEELESTASELHGVIETMMSRVTELERRHTAVTTVQDGGSVEQTPSSIEEQPPGGSRPRGGSASGPTADGPGEAQAGGSAEPGQGVPAGERGREPQDGAASTTSTAEARRGAAQRDDGRNESGSSVSGRAANGGPEGPAVEPTPDEDGNYDYVCPSCDGPLSGHPDVCIHCGTAFTW